jgi:hypothetical protein
MQESKHMQSKQWNVTVTYALKEKAIAHKNNLWKLLASGLKQHCGAGWQTARRRPSVCGHLKPGLKGDIPPFDSGGLDISWRSRVADRTEETVRLWTP